MARLLSSETLVGVECYKIMDSNIFKQGLHWIIFQMADSKKDDDRLSQKEFDKVFEKIYDQSQRPNFFFENTVHQFYSRSRDRR